MFQGVSHATLQGGGAPTFPKFLGPACTHTVCKTATKFCVVIKLKGGKFLQGQ